MKKQLIRILIVLGSPVTAFTLLGQKMAVVP